MTIFDFLFGKQKSTPPPPRPTMIPDDPAEPPQVTVLKTLVIVYDPVVDASTGKKLSQYMRWNSVEELAKGDMSDILEASGGLARHQISQRMDVEELPAKVNDYRYDANTYLSVVREAAPPYMPQ